MLAGQEAWFVAQPDSDPGRPVLLDETGTSTRMTRVHGRARRGQRCRPRGARPLLNHDLHRRPPLGGMTAPIALDGPMHGEVLLAYVD